MTQMHSVQTAEQERAWLVATTVGDQPRADVEDSLRELHALADTAQALACEPGDSVRLTPFTPVVGQGEQA